MPRQRKLTAGMWKRGNTYYARFRAGGRLVRKRLSSDYTAAVTLFAGEGPRTIIDQISRDPESLARSLAVSLRSLYHPKLVTRYGCLLAIGPEHARVFGRAGSGKDHLLATLHELLQVPEDELVPGAGGIAEGLPVDQVDGAVPKFRPDELLIVHCGGAAGMFSVMIGGWLTGSRGSQPVCRRVVP